MSEEKFGKGPEFGRHGHHGGQHRGLGFHHSAIIETTASLLGVEESAIHTQLQEGQTLAQIAEAGGLTKEEYLQKLEKSVTAAIDEKLLTGAKRPAASN